MQQDLHNVQVQVQRRENILIRTDRVLVIAAHHHLRVIDQIHAEQKRPQRGVHQRYGPAREEERHQAQHQQNYRRHKQGATKHSEVAK